jgi:hypothetical protein
VGGIVAALEQQHPQQRSAVRTVGKPRTRQARAAVIAVLAERSLRLGYAAIKDDMRLGEHLGLDAAGIEAAKRAVLETIQRTAPQRSVLKLKIGPGSTVKSFVDAVGALPGDPTTGEKG